MKHAAAVTQYIGLALIVLASRIAGADTALTSGQPVALSLPESTYVSNFYIDVDNSAKQLTVTVNGSGGDVDLFLRYATPFPTQDSSATYPTVNYELLMRNAQYHSMSSTSDESITVLTSNYVPLQAGRWYIAAINGGSAAAGTGGTTSATLTASTSTSAATVAMTIDFAHPSTDPSDPTNDCDDAFWNDTTAATPVGGNPGTTLGAQRKNALTYAAQQLVQQLQIPVAITVHACGAHLGGDSTSAILAHASPSTFFPDEPGFPINTFAQKYTWYPATVAVRVSGASLCGVGGGPCDGTNNNVIDAVFNEDIGTSTVIGGEQFYYGYTAPTGGGIDFISIAMHEMTHGLGFIGLANTDPTQGPLGAKAGISDAAPGVFAYQNYTDGPYDDIYDNHVAIVDSVTKVYTPFMGYEVTGARDATRAAALVSGPTVTSEGQYDPGLFTAIRWSDPVAASASVNINAGNAVPDNFPSLYAPCDKSKTTTCTTQPSSTLSHTVQAGDMMNAYYSSQNLRSMGLAAPMLSPEGWSNAISAMPTYTTPMPSAWYDRTHSGHGFDFQLGFHDSVHGDVYVLTLYTYTDNGTPEWYEAVGNLVDGVFLPPLDANGNSLHRVVYTTTSSSIVSQELDPSIQGSVIVDFNQAANHPACRNLDRSGSTQLGIMYWAIGGDTGTWCVQPIVPLNAHGSPDYNGLWYAPSDSGWGFEVLDVASSTGGPDFVNVLMYLPGANDLSFWLTGSGNVQNGNTVTMQLQQVTSGYCRTCTPPPEQIGSVVGTMTLTFDPPNPARGYTTGTATISANYVGGGGFQRTNIPISMLSVPTDMLNVTP
jgi:hypothetical protein